MPPARPEVSAVITTTGRPELRRSVLSALYQTGPVTEVIVVDDGRTAVRTEAIADGDTRVRVVRSGGVGANAARNLGVSTARGHYVALLDDDDVWLPTKVEAQLSAIDRSGAEEHVIVTCAALIERSGMILPKVPYDGGPIADYLFRRPLTSPRENAFVQTSGLLFDRALALAVPFDESLRSHQDWDWVIRAADHARLVAVPSVQYIYSHGDGAGVAGTARLAQEHEWALRTLAPRSKALFGYFLTFAAHKSLLFGDRRMWVLSVLRAFRYGRFDAGSFASFLPATAYNWVFERPGFQRSRARSGG